MKEEQIVLQCGLSNQAINGASYCDSLFPAIQIDLCSLRKGVNWIRQMIESLGFFIKYSFSDPAPCKTS